MKSLGLGMHRSCREAGRKKPQKAQKAQKSLFFLCLLCLLWFLPSPFLFQSHSSMMMESSSGAGCKWPDIIVLAQVFQRSNASSLSLGRIFSAAS